MRARPFLKWAGGKAAYVDTIAAALPKKIDIYYEPFLGGGAVFFHLANTQRFRHAFLSDACGDLIDTYQAIKETFGKARGVDSWLATFERRYMKKADRSLGHAEAFYMECRERSNETMEPAQKAATFIFLNKTCFNGLYRVNRKGKFNVSFGKNASPKIYDKEELRAVAKALKKADLFRLDFKDAVDLAEKGDAIYLDPPYFPRKKESFTGYSPEQFAKREHIRLFRAWADAAARGAVLVQTNSDVPQIRKLYESYRVLNMQQRRSISAKPVGRLKLNDLLIVSGGVHHGSG